MLPLKFACNITRSAAVAALRKSAIVSAGLLFTFVACSTLMYAQSVSGLKVQDRSHDNDDVDNQLYALYEIDNTGTGTTPTAVALSNLTMRYWFTNNNPSDPPVFNCDYALVNCSNITTKFVTLANPIPGEATMYMEMGFKPAAGSIQPGQNSGEIQTRIHDENYSNFLTEDTYSFISDISFVYKDTMTVTLYMNGVLVWGVEPH